ncbi:LysM peptidoglycan-binding domain-containing protein [Rhodanobacter denitrificans]|uniref:LysM peptidoglycan-binding domain-containing protein n=1 Tax=Rhodanobacter denitrificans TaxID=666685 RepID=A0A368KI67_9GAMM|nr:peptidoglycan DD-metalloendopeptidase family protein [Rhodanobacter denitrificans]RCS30858.1 LysM peptidoglycan-binding domain-containing protein [Rhodanobacter denitrificans]
MLERMDRYLPRLAVLAATALLAACGTMRSSVVVEPVAGSDYGNPPAHVAAVPSRTPIPGGSYVVARGDTLYSIAFRKGVDFRDLAQWNGVAAPYTIRPGQRLVLSPPARATPHTATVPGHVASAPSAAAAPGRAANSGAVATAGAPVFESVTAPATSASSGPATMPATAATTPSHVATPPVAPAATAAVPVAGVPTAPPATMPPPAPAAAGVSRVVSGVQWRWPADGPVVGQFRSGDAIPGIGIAGKSGDPVRAAADGVVVYSGNGLVGYGELVIIKHNDSFLSAYGHNRKRLVKEGQRVSMGQQIAEMGSTGTTRDELEFQIRKDGNPVDPLGYLPSR